MEAKLTGVDNASGVRQAVHDGSDRAANRATEQRIEALVAEALKLSGQNARKALTLSEEAYALAQMGGVTRNGEQLAAILVNQARFHYELSQLDRAQACLEEALRIADECEQAESGDPGRDRRRLRGHIYLGMGLVRWRLGDYSAALERLLEALALVREAGDRPTEANLLSNIGMVYGVTGEYAHARKVYRRALAIHEELEPGPGLGLALNNLAMVCVQAGAYEEALAHAQRGLAIAHKTGHWGLETNALDTVGAAYMGLDCLDEALAHFRQSAALAAELGDRHDELAARIHLGQAHGRRNEPQQARQALEQALSLSVALEDKEQVRHCHQELARLLKAQRDFAGALAHFEQYHEADEAIYRERADMRFKTLQVAHETTSVRQEAEIARLRNAALEAEIEERRAEAALRLAQEREKRQAALGMLAGGVAHDFNNLLVAMLGQASLALKRLEEGEDARVHVERMVQAAEQAADLTQKMLAYSGRGHFAIRALDLNKLLQEHVEAWISAHEHDEAVQLALAPNLPPVEADARQLRQMLANLMLNGIEAMSGDAAHGTIMVRTGTVEMDDGDLAPYVRYTGRPLKPGSYVKLEVADEATGIAEEHLPHIFDPFFTTKEQGRGLGLAAVLGIVRGHKAGLLVRRNRCGGTTFEVLFSVSGAEALRDIGSSQTAQANLDSGAVLVIDDEPMVREAVKDILDLEEIAVLTAEDGYAGLEVYRERRGDVRLVLLDLSMPGIGGEETYRRLQEIDPDVRVVLSSGYSARDIAGRFSGPEPVGFLQKPYSVDALVAEVRRHLGS